VTPASTCEVYGLHLTGVEGGGLPPTSAAGLPCVAVGHARQTRELACVGLKRATLDLPEGRQLLLDQDERTATFTGLRLSHDELVHPYLGAAACIFNRWAGREVYHAGAFIYGSLAWAVVGAREAGKSSLLAALASRRVPVLADDLVVTDGLQVFCGPRAIDLRRPPVLATGPVTLARGASRWRLALPPLPGAAPLGGWIYLHWCDEVTMASVPVGILGARLTGPGWMRPWTGCCRRSPLPLISGLGPDLEQAGPSASVQEMGDVPLRRLRSEPEAADEYPGQLVGRGPFGQPLPQQRR
jgi:hypothetical protein